MCTNIEFYKKAKELIGKCVVYAKEGGRKGWVGKIVDVSAENIIVDFTAMNVTQSYSISALALPCGTLHPSQMYDHSRSTTGYLIISEDADFSLYLITGEKGGDVKRVYGYNQAIATASQLAADSKSGQGYLVFKPVSKVQRETPPIKVTNFPT